MSSETSSRSTRFPIASVSAVSNAVEWVVNGGAVLPKEWTMRTRLGSSAPAELAVNASRNSASDTTLRVFIARRDPLEFTMDSGIACPAYQGRDVLLHPHVLRMGMNIGRLHLDRPPLGGESSVGAPTSWISAFCQVSSGLNFLIAKATERVFGPRSFS